VPTRDDGTPHGSRFVTMQSGPLNARLDAYRAQALCGTINHLSRTQKTRLPLCYLRRRPWQGVRAACNKASVCANRQTMAGAHVQSQLVDGFAEVSHELTDIAVAARS